MSKLKEIVAQIKDGMNRSVNRKPVYRITDNGVKVDYFNFNDKESLPFDIETYESSQIFLGEWANPWQVDLEKIAEEYGETRTEKTEGFRGREKITKYHYIEKDVLKRGVREQIDSQFNGKEIPIEKGAIPIDIDTTRVAKEYDQFSYTEPLKNLIKDKHIIPSQKYKTFMLQAAIDRTFVGGSLNFEKIKYILYGIGAATVANLVITLS